MKIVNDKSDMERYRFIAQAIGLMALLGNERPNSEQLLIVEGMIRKLHLPWDACEDTALLMQTLKL